MLRTIENGYEQTKKTPFVMQASTKVSINESANSLCSSNGLHKNPDYLAIKEKGIRNENIVNKF